VSDIGWLALRAGTRSAGQAKKPAKNKGRGWMFRTSEEETHGTV
jgi:hypothetical protein